VDTEIKELNEDLESVEAKKMTEQKEAEPEETAAAEEAPIAKPDYSGEIIDIIRSNTSPKVMRERLDD